MLEKETGLGSSATRYGGRVGRSYDDNDDIVDNDDEKSIEQTSTKSKTTTSTKKKKTTTTSSRTKSTTPKRIKRQHLVNSPMLSLDNAMNDNEAVSWLNRVRNLLLKEEAVDTASSSNAINNDATSDDTTATTTTTTTSIKMTSTPRTMQILAEPKIDGLGLSLRYRLGDNDNEDDCNIYHFIWGATRGDGTKGEDVTEAVRSAWMMMMMGEESNDNSTQRVPHSFAIPKAWNDSAGVQH
jgi:NAD-dependent DNA ligase